MRSSADLFPNWGRRAVCWDGDRCTIVYETPEQYLHVLQHMSENW